MKINGGVHNTVCKFMWFLEGVGVILKKLPIDQNFLFTFDLQEKIDSQFDILSLRHVIGVDLYST